ncbi:hypothetical protein [Streptomyces jumonjinensis]
MIFSRCSLREATFTGTDLGGGLFADCDLQLAEALAAELELTYGEDPDSA